VIREAEATSGSARAPPAGTMEMVTPLASAKDVSRVPALLNKFAGD
jgi:hypothetical protein